MNSKFTCLKDKKNGLGKFKLYKIRKLYNSIIKVSFHYSIFSHSNLHLPLPILLFPFLLHVLKISQSSIEVSFLLINNLYTKKIFTF